MGKKNKKSTRCENKSENHYAHFNFHHRAHTFGKSCAMCSVHTRSLFALFLFHTNTHKFPLYSFWSLMAYTHTPKLNHPESNRSEKHIPHIQITFPKKELIEWIHTQFKLVLCVVRMYVYLSTNKIY